MALHLGEVAPGHLGYVRVRGVDELGHPRFQHLTQEEIERIVDLELKQVHLLLREQQMVLNVTERGHKYLAEKGYSKEYGARPLRRLIQSEVEDPLSEGLLAGLYKPGDIITADLAESGEGLVFQVTGHQETEEAVEEEQPNGQPESTMPLFGA